jgi:hypothetical protein
MSTLPNWAHLLLALFLLVEELALAIGPLEAVKQEPI